MSHTRRTFIKNSICLASASLLASSPLLFAAEAAGGRAGETAGSLEGALVPDPNLLLRETFAKLAPGGKVSLPWASSIPAASSVVVNPAGGGKSLLLKGPGTLSASFTSMMPERSYRLILKTQAPKSTQRKSGLPANQMTVRFFGLDGQNVGKVNLAVPVVVEDSEWSISDTTFLVPAMAVTANLVLELKAGQAVTLSEVALRQVASVESFDWRFWNAWSILPPADTRTLRREFEMTGAPTFGIARVEGVPATMAALYLNGNAIEAVEGNTFPLHAYLKKGQNTLELRFKENNNRPCEAGIDIVVGDAEGHAQVLLGDDRAWQVQRKGSAAWAEPEFARSTYKPEELQFSKAGWVAPKEIPEAVIKPYRAQLSNLALPASGKIDSDVKISFDLKALEAIYTSNNRLRLEWLDQNKNVVWAQYFYPQPAFQYVKPGEKRHFDLSLTTRYLPAAGQYTVRLAAPALDFGAGNELGRIQITGNKSHGLAHTQIRWNGTVPHFTINGADYPPALYIHYDFHPVQEPHYIEDYIHDFAGIGIDLVDVNFRLGEGRAKDASARSNVIWLGPGKYNYKALDQLLSSPLHANPNAFIMIRLIFDEPKWWSEAHADEMVIVDDDKKGPGASYASKAWREDTAKAIKDILTYIRAQAYGPRIFGIYLTGGFDGQWMQFFDTSRIPYGFTDYSEPMRKAFQDWLRQNYDNDEKKLQAAWGNAGITFEKATVPSREKRLGTTYYLDPIKDRDVIDYNYCWRDETYYCLTAFCRSIKAASDGQWLAGSYYLPSEDITFFCAQAYLSRKHEIYHHKDFDFIGQPASYLTRPLDHIGNPQNFLTPALYGKLLYHEQDIRTFLNSAPDEPLWGGNEAYNSLAVIRRNLAQDLTQNVSWYMYDMYGGWYHSPVLLAEIKRFLDIDKARFSLKTSQKVQTQIVRVTTEGTLFHKRMNTQDDISQTHFLVLEMLAELQRIGFNADNCMLEDIGHPALAAHKVYLLDDFFSLNEAQRKKIDLLKRDGNIIVFTHAIGYMTDDSISVKSVSEITGMEMGETTPGADFSPMNYRFLKQEHPASKQLGNVRVDTTPAKRFHVIDPAAVPLAKYVEGNQTAAAIKQFGDWTAVYVGSAIFPHQLIANLARMAGVHSYGQIKNTTITYGNGFLAVYAQQNGVQGTLSLPSGTVAYDVFAGKRVVAAASKFKVSLQQGQTALYFVGSESEVKQFISLYELHSQR